MSNATLQRWLMILAILALIAYLIRVFPFPLERVLAVLLTSSLIAAAVSPVASSLERFRIPRWLTIIVVYLMATLIVIGAVVLLLPLVAGETELFRIQLPAYIFRLQELVAQTPLDPLDQNSLNGAFRQLMAEVGGIAGRLAGIVRDVLNVGVTAIIVLVIAFFMAVEKGFAVGLITRFVPPQHRMRTLEILGKIGNRLGAWVRAQALLAAFFGISFGAGLWLIGVPYAVTLAVVGMILEIIPYVGGATTMVLAILVALTKSPLLVLFTVVWYTIVVQIQGHVMAPLLLGRPLGLHPLVVVLALFVGIETFGVYGSLLAVPIAIVVQVLLDEFYVFEEANPESDAAVNPAEDVGHV